jgi:hypothetical protein
MICKQYTSFHNFTIITSTTLCKKLVPWQSEMPPELCLVMDSPAVENTCSDGAEAAGIHKILDAKQTNFNEFGR